MKASLIKELNALRARKIPLALVTELESGLQTIVSDPDGSGDLKSGGAFAAGQGLSDAVASALRFDRSGTHEADGQSYFINIFNPPLRLMIIGAVHISQALVPLAQLTGYEVTVIDPRTAFASADRFPGLALDTDWPDEALERLAPDRRSAVVTLTHDPKLDDPALEIALKSPAFYIAALGSRKTHGARIERLAAAGFTEAEMTRIHGPAGLDIGARTPAEIALSVMAQMTLALRGPKARKPADTPSTNAAA